MVFFFLALDLGVFHRKAHAVTAKEAGIWTTVWVSMSLLFSLVVYLIYQNHWLDIGLNVPVIGKPGQTMTVDGRGAVGLYLAGYIVELSLSVDNLFVIALIFQFFAIPAKYQHRVLFWGIVGALVFRAIFIALGAVVLSAFVWTMVVFGLFLIATGIKMLATHGKSIDPGNNPLVRVFRRIMPTTDDYHGQRFFVRQNGALLATPLFVALLVVEFTDVLFAVDSVPAIFSITQNPFIVFTSNVFAILGLRALFFAVAGLMQLFRFLHFGLAAILMFVGVKMLYGYAQKVLVPDWPHFPIGLSLAIIVGVLASSILASVLLPVGPGNDDAPGTSSRPQQPKERELGR